MTHLAPVLRPVLGSPFRRSDVYRIAGALPALHLSPRLRGDWTDLISGTDLTTFSRANTQPTYELDGAGGLVGFSSGQRAIGVSPETGVRGGSIFGQRTQLLTGTEDFSNTFWSASSATRSNNQATAPNNTVTAALVTGTGATYGGLVRKYITYAQTTTYTFSCYAKAGTASFIGLRLGTSCVSGDNYCYYNLTTGAATAITPAAGTVNRVEAQFVGNGWYRCVLVYTTSATQAASDFVDIAIVSSGGSHQSATTNNLYIWGANVTAGSVLYPYIGGAITCPADVLSIDGTNFSRWYNQNGGTLLVSASRQVVPSGEFAIIACLSDGTINNNIEADYITENVAGLVVFTGGSSIAELYPSVTTRKRTIAGRFATNNYAVSVNGGGLLTDTAGALPSVDRLRIGAGPTGLQFLNGHVYDLLYWPPGSPAEQRLQQLSAAL